ncbi:MAG: helix-turn-helix transcriptional regulator [Candidatus Sericytochromatia bacterium]
MGNNWPTADRWEGYAREVARDFGARVRELRRSRGLSQEDLARALSYHQTTIAKLEAGTRPTSVAEAHLLAEILNTDISALFVKGAGASVGYADYLGVEVERLHDELTKTRAREAKLQAEYRQARERFDEACGIKPGGIRSGGEEIHIRTLPSGQDERSSHGQHQEER